MADTKIKNIVTVDMLEDSTNKENILVESQGGLKRLPISKVKGSGGGGGAGFDLMGKEASTVVVTGGGELVECEDTEFNPEAEPTFEDIFGTGTFNQANVYVTNCTLTGMGVYKVYGYYSSTNSAWAIAVPDAGLTPEDFSSVVTVKTGLDFASSSTFADLLTIKETRPITVVISALPKEEPIPCYLYGSVDHSMMASQAEFQTALPEEAQGKNSYIVLVLTPIFPELQKEFGITLLVLFEAGTEQEPVLGTVLLKDFGD